MIVVVADTSPLNYLVQIHCEDLLRALYQRVLVPATVMAELDHPNTPAVVRAWLGHVPEWIAIRSLHSPPNASLAELDPGEREAIELGLEARADLLLMDNRRNVWRVRGAGISDRQAIPVLAMNKQEGRRFG